VDPRVDEVVLRTLEKERERRFQSAGEVKTRVENIATDAAASAAKAPPPPVIEPASKPHLPAPGWVNRAGILFTVLGLVAFPPDTDHDRRQCSHSAFRHIAGADRHCFAHAELAGAIEHRGRHRCLGFCYFLNVGPERIAVISSSDPTPRPPDSSFRTTRWTRVLEARGDSPEAQSALSDLCAAYYAAVFAFIHREGRDEDTARELTQEFFARILAKHGLDKVDPERGRFRSFLLGAAKHFLADERDRSRAAKRGGGQAPERIEAGADTKTQLQIPDPASGPPADAYFDWQWALALMERALGALETEFKAAGKGEQFEALKPWLVGETESLPQKAAASRLGLTEGALKVAIHRLRKRFRELVRSEISQTVTDSGQVEEELRYLVEVLANVAPQQTWKSN